MAIEKKGLYWYDDAANRWYYHEPLQVGDVVTFTGNRSDSFRRGDSDTVTVVMQSSNYEHEYTDKGYTPVYYQSIRVSTNSNLRTSKNWQKVKGAPVLQLETNRPVIIQEFEELTIDGKVVVKNVGDPVTVESMSAARIYTTNEISTSIREKNLYRQFKLFQEISIARAKKPEIEFA